MGLIKAWSWSRLEVFEKCPYRAFLQFVEKRDEHQASDEKRENALKRGQEMHEQAEAYVRGTLETLPKELKKSAKVLNDTREVFAQTPERVVLEEDWAFTKEWTSAGWFDENAWLRMKLDRLVFLDSDKTAGDLRDYKSGKKEGNEVKHSQQGQLFTIGAFMRYPSLQVVKVQFEYMDHGKTSLPKTYSREQAMTFLPAFDRRGRAMTEATEFPPRPNRINCAWCPFGPSKGDGSCQYGVDV